MAGWRVMRPRLNSSAEALFTIAREFFPNSAEKSQLPPVVKPLKVTLT